MNWLNAAIDTSVSPSDFLRRALVVARRLDVSELVGWISGELNGYSTKDVPDYRQVRGDLMAMNPTHGPIPFLRRPQGKILSFPRLWAYFLDIEFCALQ